MAPQAGHFLAIEGIDIDGLVLGSGSDVPVLDKVYAQDGVVVVCDYSLKFLEIHMLSPFSY